MAMKEVKTDNLMFPRPMLLVGSNVAGRSNFMAVGGGGTANANPPMIGVPIQHRHNTLVGIKENQTFSICTPSSDLVKEADYCGIVSGRDADKTADCGFNIFYGKLKTAPMIEECPLNLECRVKHILDLGTHAFVLGEIVGTYVAEDCLTDGKPDVRKIKPMIFNFESSEYLAFGEAVGKAFGSGLELKKNL